MNFIRNRNFRAGPQTSLEGFICPQNSDKQQKIKVFGRSGGVIVNCKSMGYNCSVNKGVVIGNKKGQDNRALIGDNCYFTLGCKVIGKVNIGNNVIVAQNSVVIKDISDNTIVSGIPAKPIKTFYNMDEINI